ncbi:glycosyltransferase family 2 protein [Polaromonas sp. DSR2-3-2]|uniref:glycosyltransferase family A protein n=1 Tax=unclassified Polaromonas TaxID=2638319 RepID=UPI003CF2121F
MLTIVIPSYNHENYILDCLNAACKLDVVGKKIIVIDDGSTDETEEIVRQFIEERNKDDVRLVCKKNSGLVSSLNMGLALADTEYFYLVASDDIPVLQGILQCVTELQKNPLVQFCIGGGNNFCKEWGDRKTSIYGKKHELFFGMEKHRRKKEIFLNCPAPILLQSTVFRVEALRAIGGWDPKLIWDDYPTFVKMLEKFPQKGKDFIYEPNFCVVEYRHHGSNSYKNLFKQFSILRQSYLTLAPPELLDRAIGNALGYYVLVGLRERDFKGVIKIIKTASWKARFYALPSAANVMIDKWLRSLK